ncbi:MAG: molybdopterin molybdotransferase [Microbacteriaceae bacterium]|nr:molybdopterin molybdotransferase [Microbacteriaceae bacterium]
MTSVEEHRARIAALLAPALLVADGSDDLPLLDALGRVTSTEVLSPVDLPLFRNSQMDGFALNSADLGTIPVELPVVGDLPAGPSSPAALVRGTAIRIMTGAVVPDGADCIVPVEDVAMVENTEHGGGAVTILRGRSPGEFVRNRASDLAAGDRLLPAGLTLAPRHLAAAAAAGITTIAVRKRVRIAVISTGSELVAPGETTSSGQIFDSNLVALSAAVIEAGAELVLAERSDDEPETFGDILHRATGLADLVITSGGISEGAYEVVREVLEPLGAPVGHVAMQPGGPQATALIDGVPVLSFPGNPVSTQVSFVVFARPLLLAAAGTPQVAVNALPSAGDLTSISGKRQFLRGRITDDGVEPVSSASSHLVAGMARADVLIDIPAETTMVRAGDNVRVWLL